MEVLRSVQKQTIDQLVKLIHYHLLLHREYDVFDDDICIIGMEIV